MAHRKMSVDVKKIGSGMDSAQINISLPNNLSLIANQSIFCFQGIDDDHLAAAAAAAEDDDAEENHNEDQRKWKEHIDWETSRKRCLLMYN